MDNVAVLGIKVDSSQLTSATKALQGLQAATTPAQAAVTSLGNSTKGANDNLKAHTVAVQGVANAHAGLSTQAMAAGHAVRSLAEGFAAGMPATTILAQQLNHLSYAASGPGGITGAFGEVFSTLGKFITPATLVAGGLAGIGVAATLASLSLIKSEKAVADLGERTNATLGDLHAFQTAASLKGVGTDEFTKGMERVGELTLQAQHGVGALAELFRANNIQVGDLQTNVHSLADLVQRTPEGAEQYNRMVQLGLPITREWVQFLKQGGANIDAANASVAKFSGDQQLVDKARQFDDAWNKAFVNVKNYSKSFILDMINGLSAVANLIPNLAKGFANLIPGVGLASALKGIYDAQNAPTTAPALSGGGGGSLMGLPKAPGGTTQDPAQIKQEIAWRQQLVGLLGAQATVADQVRAKQDSLTLAELEGVKGVKEHAASILEYTRNQILGVNAIQQQTDTQRIANTVATEGLSPSAATAYAVVQERINDAILRNAPLTVQEIALLRQKASVLQSVAQATQEVQAKQNLNFATSQLGRTDTEQQVATQLRAIYGDNFQAQQDSAIANQIRFNSVLGDTKSAAQGALSGFVNDLVQGRGAAVALQNAMQGVERKLIDMASNAIISNLFKNLLGAAAGGTGGGIFSFLAPTQHTGGIIGSDAGPMRNVHPALFATAPRFHSGGLVSGDVPAVLQSGEGVFTAAQMRALAPVSAGGGGGNGGPSTVVNVHNNANGTQVETRKTSQGGVDIHDIIIKTAGDAMAGGSFDGSFRARYNVPVKPRGR